MANQESPRERILLLQIGPEQSGGIAVVDLLVREALAGHDSSMVRAVALLNVGGSHSKPTAVSLTRLVRFACLAWWNLLVFRPSTILVGHVGLMRVLPPQWLMPRRRVVCWAYGIDLHRDDAARLFRRADLVLAISKETAGKAVELMPERESEIVLMPLALSSGQGQSLRESHPLPWDRPQGVRPSSSEVTGVLVVGRLDAGEPNKGHEALIRAMGSLVEERPDVELWVVGEGPDHARLATLSKKLSAPVVFFGELPDRERDRLYSAASVFALPSGKEGFGLVYLEAMAHGLPCIASTADAGKEVVLDGETGLTVEYGSVEQLKAAILKLVADPALAADFGARGRSLVEDRYSFPQFQDRLLRVLSNRSDR